MMRISTSMLHSRQKEVHVLVSVLVSVPARMATHGDLAAAAEGNRTIPSGECHERHFSHSNAVTILLLLFPPVSLAHYGCRRAVSSQSFLQFPSH